MWETLSSNPLGRLSMRKNLRFATALLVVCFAYIFVTAPTTHAADAEFDGDALTYKGQQYSGPFTATGTKPQDIPKDAKFYTATDASDSTKGSIIYFAANADPSQTTTAQIRTGDFDVRSGVFSNLSPPKNITVGIATVSGAATASSCNQGGVGWIICPLSHWIADGVDYLYKMLSNFFIFEPLTTSGPTSSIYMLWNYVRNFANIAFVIAFLIVIYSQITNNAMSNYTVKKILPRIVVAAILVNTSYWICAVAIDISNIMGVAIRDLLTNLRDGLGAANTVDLPTWGDVASAILGGTGLVLGATGVLLATGGTAAGLGLLLLGALLPVIFAALIAVTILAARQAIMTVFVIIAPLAFVAYLLPNTEDWFNKWRKLFMTALIMFPAFSLLFGVSQLAGIIIIQNAKDISVALLGLTVQVIPLFITPFLIKLSSGLLGTIAGLANDRSKGLFDRTKNWADSNREYHRQRGFSKRPAQSRAGHLRPTDMAQRLNNRSLYREQMTAKHKAKAEAQFAETDRGRRVYDRGKDAELRQHAANAGNLEAYNQAVYGTPGVTGSGSVHRQALHHNAHTAEGRAKLIEDQATAHAERDLQTQVNSTVALRNLKIETDVDTAHGKLQSESVESDAKLEFQNQVDNDRALKLMKVATFVTEKEATSIDNRLTKNAETRWNQLTRTDANLQQLRLNETKATLAATDAEQKWNSLIENIQARGNERNSAGNLIVPDLAAGSANLAGSIKALHREIETETNTQSSAKLVQQTDFTEALNNSVQLRNRAAGVDKRGANRVLASAKAAVTKELITNTDNFQNTLDYNEVQSNIDELERRFKALPNDPSFMPERVAYARLLGKNGSPGLDRLRSVLTEYTANYAPDEDNVMILKEILAGEQSLRNASRDLEVWANNERDGNGNLYANFEAVSNTPGVWKSITGQRFATMAQPAQEHALKLLQTNDPDALTRLASRVMQDPTARSAVKDRPLLMLQAIERGEDISNF